MSASTLTFVLGLKGLLYKPAESADSLGQFLSPQKTGTLWPREGLVVGDCYYRRNHPGGVPAEGCTCGIYATFDRGVLNGYTAQEDRAVFLLQGWPRFIVGNANGWRAASATVLAVIELPLNPVQLTVPKRPIIGDPFPSDPTATRVIDALAHPTQNLVGAIGQEYFGVGSISMAVALEMMERHNAQYLP